MNKKIVVINGTGGSGKDTFVNFCSNYCSVFNFSSIDKVKEIATLMGWSGGKTEKDRKFLADLKALSTDYNDMPYNSIVDAIKEFNTMDKELMFIHIREPKEIDKVIKNFDAISLLIKRTNYETINSNDSDKNVENYNYDYIIENDTLEEFEKKAQAFVSEVLEK